MAKALKKTIKELDKQIKGVKGLMTTDYARYDSVSSSNPKKGIRDTSTANSRRNFKTGNMPSQKLAAEIKKQVKGVKGVMNPRTYHRQLPKQGTKGLAPMTYMPPTGYTPKEMATILMAELKKSGKNTRGLAKALVPGVPAVKLLEKLRKKGK